MRELVNLEGNPRPEVAARHVRVVALDIALAVKWPSNEGFWPDDDGMYDAIRQFGIRLYNTQADVMVIFNTPFAGTRVRDIAVGELLAVELARPWRVESTSWNRHWSALGGVLPSQQVGTIDAGVLVLSRWPITESSFVAAEAATEQSWAQRQWGARAGITDLTIEAGPEQALRVQVRDVPGEPLVSVPDAPLHVVVSHDAQSSPETANAQVATSTQIVWSDDLRYLQHANHNDLQGMLAEPLLLVDLGIAPDANVFVPPSAREGSADEGSARSTGAEGSGVGAAGASTDDSATAGVTTPDSADSGSGVVTNEASGVATP